MVKPPVMASHLYGHGGNGGADHPSGTPPRRHHGGMESQLLRPGHLTAHQTRQVLGISAGALRNLVYRGQLTRSCGTERHPYYAVPDVSALALKRQNRAAA